MVFENTGVCAICNAATTFRAEGQWLRDSYVCIHCGSIPRQRALTEVLTYFRPHWRNLSIHESSPTSGFFADNCRRYSQSFFFEDTPLGESKKGQRCENLEKLTFADGSFDVFITQDVLEHVFEPERALAEIMRVLKPGGAHVFTAPKHKQLLKSVRRASLANGRIEHHLEPQYHGNPIGDGKSLVTWDYGADFDDLIQQWTGYCTSNFIIRDRARGIDGEFLDVFVTQKTPENLLVPEGLHEGQPPLHAQARRRPGIVSRGLRVIQRQGWRTFARQVLRWAARYVAGRS